MARKPIDAQLHVRFHIDQFGSEGPMCIFSVRRLITFALEQGVRGSRVSCDRTGLRFVWAAAA